MLYSSIIEIICPMDFGTLESIQDFHYHSFYGRATKHRTLKTGLLIWNSQQNRSLTCYSTMNVTIICGYCSNLQKIEHEACYSKVRVIWLVQMIDNETELEETKHRTRREVPKLIRLACSLRSIVLGFLMKVKAKNDS